MRVEHDNILPYSLNPRRFFDGLHKIPTFKVARLSGYGAATRAYLLQGASLSNRPERADDDHALWVMGPSVMPDVLSTSSINAFV